MGLTRCMQKLKLLRAPKKNTKSKQKLFALGSNLKYELAYDEKILKRMIAACGRVVTSVEGELTNKVLLEHATKWASALRVGLFPLKSSFTAPGKGILNNKKHKTKKTANKKQTESVSALNAPLMIGHFVRKQALWLIQAHKDQDTCRVDYSQMSLLDVATLMPDSLHLLRQVGLSEKASVFDFVEGIDPLTIATFLCLFVPVEKELDHLSAMLNPANHELALRLIEEHKSSAGVPPSPSWLAHEIAKVTTGKVRCCDHRPRDHQTSMTGSCSKRAVTAKAMAQDKSQEAPANDQRPQSHKTSLAKAAEALLVENEHVDGDVTKWHAGPVAPNQKLRCSCSGNCRRMCPGRSGSYPSIAVVNLQGTSLKKNLKPLCAACKCQHPECHVAARRPHGAHHLNISNFGGFCQKHWKWCA